MSDYKGNEYQRIEYIPYGETWVEKTQNTGLEFLLYKFTGKEIDEETGRCLQLGELAVVAVVVTLD